MAEYEKGLCKKKYSDIGKDVVDGKTVDEIAIVEELNFGNQKATNMKRDKRITLSKSASIQLESFMEVRRKRASELYDICMKELGEGAEKGMDNLSRAEKRGLRRRKKRVASWEIIVCQTDKFGRFCVLTRQQYLEAASSILTRTERSPWRNNRRPRDL